MGNFANRDHFLEAATGRVRLRSEQRVTAPDRLRVLPYVRTEPTA